MLLQNGGKKRIILKKYWIYNFFYGLLELLYEGRPESNDQI